MRTCSACKAQRYEVVRHNVAAAKMSKYRLPTHPGDTLLLACSSRGRLDVRISRVPAVVLLA